MKTSPKIPSGGNICKADRSPQQTRGSAIFGGQAWAEIGHSLKLSERELQIIRGVFDDRTEFAIATDLDISPHTVHTHVERLHRKLGIGDRAQLLLRITNEFLALTTALGSTLPPICANRVAGRCPLQSTVQSKPSAVGSLVVG